VFKLRTFTVFQKFELINNNFKQKKRHACEPVLVRDPMPRQIFKIVKQLNHPNLMDLDYFVDDGFFYVVRSYDDDYVIVYILKNNIIFVKFKFQLLNKVRFLVAPPNPKISRNKT
jgi:hypothetical protein